MKIENGKPAFDYPIRMSRPRLLRSGGANSSTRFAEHLYVEVR